MSTNRHIDKICCIVIAFTLVLTALFANAEKFGITAETGQIGYEQRLFDITRVHTIDIVMDDWEGFLKTCENEEYEWCSVIIDQEAYRNVGIRAKGNTSLSMVSSYGNDRYSFKIEFDHYDNAKTYYGLDKLSLNNIIQDNTYMKDYLVYQMMADFDVNAPLCSYVYITVNGEEWGLYLAVEGVEDSFLERNYGSDYGNLYKPDNMNIGGGRGNGEGFDFNKFRQKNSDNDASSEMRPDINQKVQPSENGVGEGQKMQSPRNNTQKDQEMQPMEGDLEEGQRMQSSKKGMQPPDGLNFDDISVHGPGGNGMRSDDVSLIYSDDNYDSYSNIFDHAKTAISDSDKERLITSIKAMNKGSNMEECVNIEEVIRYFVVHNFVCNFDSYTGTMVHNYYLYEEDGRMSMIPWDYNLAFGGFQSQTDATGLINYPIDSPVSDGDTNSRPMIAWILNNEQYLALYHQYFTEFISEYFDSGYFTETVERVSTMIAPYVEKDPTKFCSFEEYETGIATLKQFCLLRAESVSGQLDGTIPSDQAGQTKDNSTLVDGSSITISDMGSMGNGPGK